MKRLRLVNAAPAGPRKPVYERVPLFGAVIVDRRDAWQARRDAMESERLRAAAIAQSRGRA